MSEEVEKSESTGGSLKNVIIGFISTITLGVGGWVTTKLTGGEDKEAPAQQAAPVINITNSNQQAQSAGGKTVIIKEKETVKEAAPQPKPKKKEGDEFKEAPAQW
jgi:hypothetical protein